MFEMNFIVFLFSGFFSYVNACVPYFTSKELSCNAFLLTRFNIFKLPIWSQKNYIKLYNDGSLCDKEYKVPGLYVDLFLVSFRDAIIKTLKINLVGIGVTGQICTGGYAGKAYCHEKWLKYCPDKSYMIRIDCFNLGAIQNRPTAKATHFDCTCVYANNNK